MLKKSFVSELLRLLKVPSDYGKKNSTAITLPKQTLVVHKLGKFEAQKSYI